VSEQCRRRGGGPKSGRDLRGRNRRLHTLMTRAEACVIRRAISSLRCPSRIRQLPRSAVQALPGTNAPCDLDLRHARLRASCRLPPLGRATRSPFNTFSYKNNFSSTTGKLSAKFGPAYVNSRRPKTRSKAPRNRRERSRLFVFPVAGRDDDGVPKAAISFDLGLVPTAYVSGPAQFLTLPFV